MKRIFSFALAVFILISGLIIPEIDSEAASSNISAPTGIIQTEKGTKIGESISWKWNKVDGAEKYFVRIWDVQKKKYVNTNNNQNGEFTQDTSYTFYTKRRATIYKICVYAKGKDGNWSSMACKNGYTCPQTPYNIHIYKWTKNYIIIRWSGYKKDDYVLSTGFELEFYSLKGEKLDIDIANKEAKPLKKNDYFNYARIDLKDENKKLNEGFRVRVRAYKTLKNGNYDAKDRKLRGDWSASSKKLMNSSECVFIPQVKIKKITENTKTNKGYKTICWYPIENAIQYNIYYIKTTKNKNGSVSTPELIKRIPKKDFSKLISKENAKLYCYEKLEKKYAVEGKGVFITADIKVNGKTYTFKPKKQIFITTSISSPK